MKTRKKPTILLTITFFMVVSVAASAYIPLRLNTSKSMPIGLYRVTNQSIKRGSIVSVCLPASIAKMGINRHYLSSGRCQSGAEPVVKQVVAVNNDRVDLSTESVKVDGYNIAHSRTFDVDTMGRKIPAIKRKHYKVKSYTVWLIGTYDERSWDSRYYGAIEEKQIQHVLTPLITSGEKS